MPQSSFRLCSSLGQYLAGKQTGTGIAVGVGFWNAWVTWAVPVEDGDESSWFPVDFELKQNHPNPFNLTTLIEYELPRASQVRIQIYNVLGQRVRFLVDELQPAGRIKVQWDGRDDQGVEVAAGVYFCRMAAGDFVGCKKMTLLK